MVFNRFHVERLATDPLDQVRRAEQRGLALAATRYPSLKHPTRLKPVEPAAWRRLEQAPASEAPAVLEKCVDWAARSRSRPFICVARTIRKHAPGILRYLDT